MKVYAKSGEKDTHGKMDRAKVLPSFGRISRSWSMLWGQKEEAVEPVREFADCSLQDVVVKGGMGDNEILNGLYFKLVGDFGGPLYRCVKPGNITVNGKPVLVERYLYKDASKWVISDKTSGPCQKLPGMAFAMGPQTLTNMEDVTPNA